MSYDPWESLRRYTAARIALGRAGGSILTRELLDFRLAHARARDAVYSSFDVPMLERGFGNIGHPCLHLRSRAPNRQEYLLRPDLGRRLNDISRADLSQVGRGFDLALIVSDGLSAEAVRCNALPFFESLLPLARDCSLSLSPVAIVEGGRVAIQDEIGECLQARIALIAIGERPGLGSADSMGVYFVYDPRLGRSDADRNCISNIRAAGLPAAEAAHKVLYLIRQSLLLGLSGVSLKDEGGLLPQSS